MTAKDWAAGPNPMTTLGLRGVLRGAEAQKKTDLRCSRSE